MPSAAHAYRYDAYAQAEPLRAPRTHVRVVHGREPEPGISARTVSLVKLFMVALVAVAVVCCVRVGLTAASTSATIAQADITEQANSLTSENASLQMQIASLSSPSYVKDRATAMGMHAAASTETITLPDDPVAYNDDGSLSLSGSLSASN